MALTMNVIERTREIGIMRSMGARSGNLMKVFGVEGLMMAVTGWLAGIPVGYGLLRLIGFMIYELYRVCESRS